MGSIPSNVEAKVPAIGFIAHVDTAPDASGADIKPQIVEHYDGGEIALAGVPGLALKPSEFPEMLHYVGQTLVTTDGTTLLGADDKAGVAEIMDAVQYIVAHPEFKHGPIKIGFTPDEEIGRGVVKFDVPRFGADYAYTRWTAARSANWSSRTSTPHRPRSTSRAGTCTRAMRRAR